MPAQPLKKTDEEIGNLAKLVVDNYEDESIRTQFQSLVLQLLVEPKLFAECN